MLPKSDKAMVLMTGNKISVPLSAMFGDEKQSVIIKVDGCKPTVIADLGKLAAGSSIMTLEPEDGSTSGYCFYVNIVSFMRKVYREDYQNVITRGNATQDSELQTYATKYQICLHSCLVFENTLPIRVQFKVVAQKSALQAESVLRAGTLSPGEEVHLHEFQKNAQLLLRLPEMDSIWTRAINLGDCIFREGMDRSVRSMLGAAGHWDPIVEFIPSLQSSDVIFKNEEDTDSKKVISRLDFTAADDGSPRVVLYCSLWIYNQSHVQTMLFRCADEINPHVLHAPQLVPQRPVPRLMDCPGLAFEMSTIIDHEVSRWSEKIHSTVVGIQAPIALKFGSKLGPKSRNEIGISIQRPMGQFHRTTQVVVTSRFVFVNKTNSAFKVSQNGRDNDRVVELPTVSKSGEPTTCHFDFDASAKNTKREVYIRMDHSGAEWSGPFSVVEEKEFPLKLKGAVPKRWGESGSDEFERDGFSLSDVHMPRLRVRISTVGASMVVTLMKDDPPMYLICNQSSSDLLVNQVYSSDETVIIQSMEYVPFAWLKPDGARRVSCRAVAPGQHHSSSPVSRVYDFANLDREKRADGLKFWLFGEQIKNISAEILVERSSRVLVFRDQYLDIPPSYILEVKVIAARLKNDISLRQDALAEFLVETDHQSPIAIESKEVKTAHVYRFDSDMEFECTSRPKKLMLNFYENQRDVVTRELAASLIGIDDENLFHCSQLHNDMTLPPSPMDGEGAGPFEMMRTPLGSPTTREQAVSEGASLPRHRPFYEKDDSFVGEPLHLSDAERVSVSSSETSEAEERHADILKESSGVVEIRIPKKAWSRFGVGAKRSLAWSYNNGEQAKRSLGRREGHWWEMRHPETGEIVGEVQVALKFRTSEREHTHPTNIFNVGLSIPSIGVSFLHNANSNMVEVAYLSMQRMGLLYSRVGGSSEIIFSLGNLQMDNQMDAEVVLGPKVHRVKEGVSVRLRDRWRNAINYRYRGIFEQLDTTSMSVVQFRMLWNSSCTAGEVTHYELIELIMQEVEISTDEKFVVNLITVFQGLEGLTSPHTFEEIVNTQLDYANSGSGAASSGSGGAAADENGAAITDGIYIEELNIESIRLKFSMELNGGRHIKTLGPSGRRLAVYLPESNVKDFRLYLTKLTFNHLYEPKSSVIEKVTRRYQQQAVILVLRGLHTVSVYANPFRIVYRLGHGLVELVRMPARGLASGSPVELITGAYLGVRSLAMNTISASYEIVAGATGIFGAFLSPLVPESKRKAFDEDLIGFQRAVIEEVDSFDAAEERTMTKVIVRKPRVFDPAGVGLLTVYGPGSVPLEEQDRIDHKAVVLLQHWWRRRRRANLIYEEALRLRPEIGRVSARHAHGLTCAIM
uniref:Vacuolar protein sorting-associated protein 13 VPS13 adaptor binding domain-containing protein n=1 Tax=Globisporangium ultimum (strain ATCC 200006 / CBS 805.95 / DAOM BR144) TaxID=431595 RepID=K3X4F3_GLOUD